jgi:hypothetical protein
MGADGPTDDTGAGGAPDRTPSRRETRAERRAERRAREDERATAERDERYRADRDAERARSEAGEPLDERMRRALEEVRREGLKVAVIYAAVDAALAALVVNLLLQVLNPDGIPATLPWPRVVADAVVGATGAPPGPLQTPIVVGAVAGVVVAAAEVVARTRRPLVEQFEGANPEVREALRTARDTVRAGADSRMALALYEDVLARLRRTSSAKLVNVRRIFVTVLVVSLVSVASIQVAVVDLDIGDLGGDGDGGDLDEQSSDYEGLQDASGVLGEPENVTAGEETLNTTLATQGGGDDGAGGAAAAAYDSGGFAGGTDVEGQQAGFAEQEQLEEAELIREYNLRIRTEDDSDT